MTLSSYSLPTRDASGEHVRDEVPQLGQEAFIGLPSRFVHSFRAHTSPEVLLLTFLTWTGAYVGRQRYVRLAGCRVWGNLFLLQVGEGLHPAVAAVEGFFEWSGRHPLMLRSGLTSGQSLVWHVRDPLQRFDKVLVRRRPPVWDRTTVDGGTVERRLIVAQPSLVRILSRNTQAALSLRETLVDGFRGRNLAQYMSHRDGGYLESSGPHVVVAAACEPQELLTLPKEFGALCLIAAEGGCPVFGGLPPSDADKFMELQTEFWDVLEDRSLSEITLAPATARIFERALSRAGPGEREASALKLAKLGLVYALLNGSAQLSAEHAAAAVSVLRYSDAVRQHLTAGINTARVAARIDAALRHCPRGLTRTQLNRRLNGKAKAAVIDAAFEQLARSGRARREFHRTPGRSAERWYPEGGEAA